MKVAASNLKLKLGRRRGYLDAHLNLAIYLDCAPTPLEEPAVVVFSRKSGKLPTLNCII